MEIFPNCRRTLVVLDEKYAREFPRVISSFRLEDIVKIDRGHSFLKAPEYEDTIQLEERYIVDKIKESPIVKDLLVISLYKSHPSLLPHQNFPNDYNNELSDDVRRALMNNQVNFKSPEHHEIIRD